MENKQMKCIKGESCLHCGSNYCRFVDELDQLKADREEALKQLEFVRTLNTVREAEIRKLTKTVAEIKEIVRQEIVCDDCNFQGTDKCDSKLCTSFYLDEFCKNLLQKISECEGNNENNKNISA